MPPGGDCERLRKFRLAICGGGIAGLTLALALHKYSAPGAPVEVNIYEADPEVRTAGAGITIWPRTWAIMRELGLYSALWGLAVRGSSDTTFGTEARPKPAFVARKADQPAEGFTYARVLAPNGSATMHRRDMMDVFLRALPPECKLHTSKRLSTYVERTSGIVLHFEDGTTAEADALAGADGIHSSTRDCMYTEAHRQECVPHGAGLGLEDCGRCKAAAPVWTGIHSYRCLIPTEELYALNPAHTTRTIGSILCYSGRGKHIITYQISGGRFLNFVALCRVPNGEGRPYPGQWVTEVAPDDVRSQFTSWEAEVQQMLRCVRRPARWAIHVVQDLPFAVRGHVALVGDALHAMAPNFGAGGGQAIEDAYLLGRLLADPRVTLSHLPDVLRVYERVRLPFTADVARRAREVGLMYELDAPGFYVGQCDGESGLGEGEGEREALEKLGREIQRMWEWQWTEGVEEQVEDALRGLDELLHSA